MTYFWKPLLIVLPFLLIGGCAVPQPAPKPVAPDPVLMRIDAAIADGAKEKPIGFETPVQRPVYTNARTIVSYAGDASQLLKDAAREMKLDFLVTGPQPHLPIFVQIDVKRVSFEDFLRQVAAQLGQRADIELRDSAIELKYR